MKQNNSIGHYDIAIVGGGPAGSSCALSLADSGLKIILLDKAQFPRDKICGDALSLDVINQLPKLSKSLALDFEKSVEKIPSYGVTLISPDSTSIDLPFIYKGSAKHGYVCPRMAFDDFLFQEVRNNSNIEVIENCQVESVAYGDDCVNISTNKGHYKASMIVGADGANSVVQHLTGKKSIDRKHHSAGLRMYYEGVSFQGNGNFIELYFFKEILPGYLWIFPMNEDRANVGIGMLSSVVSKKKINLKKTLEQLLSSHPALKERFKHAKPLEQVKGHGLPLGSKKRTISGDRFLLLGDAAGLIDPFTGEGIGNAIRSGRVAADHLRRNFVKQNFSAHFNKSYDKEIYQKMGKEFRVSSALQTLCSYPVLFNFVFRKAKQSKYLHDFLIKALADIDQKKQFLNPLFYYRLFFG